MLVIGLWWSSGFEDQLESGSEPQARTPDYTFEGVRLTSLSPKGKPLYKIETPFMAHFSDDKSMELESPVLSVYRQGAPPMRVHSDRAWISDAGEEIMLLGAVTIIRPETDASTTTTIETENLQLFPNKQTASTEASVLAYNETYRIQGVGGSLHLGNGYFKIHHQARGVYVP